MKQDLGALESALEQQFATLAPIARRLHVDAMRPLVAPHDWSGPASGAYRDLENALRERLRHAAAAADEAMHSCRRALVFVEHIVVMDVPGV